MTRPLMSDAGSLPIRRVFVHGSMERFKKYSTDIDAPIKLGLGSLFQLTENDIVIVMRSWSPLFEIIINHKKKRPKIIQFADGFVFNASRFSKKNDRYGGLHEKALYDAFVSYNEFRDHCYGHKFVSITTKKIKLKNIVLVLGNDFYFDKKISIALKTLGKLKENKKMYEYYISTTSRFARLFFGNMGFESADFEYLRTDETLVVSTPSTFMFELAMRGYVVAIHSSYNFDDLSNMVVNHEHAIEYQIGSAIVQQAQKIDVKNIKKRRISYKLDSKYLLRYIAGDVLELLR